MVWDSVLFTGHWYRYWYRVLVSVLYSGIEMANTEKVHKMADTYYMHVHVHVPAGISGHFVVEVWAPQSD